MLRVLVMSASGSAFNTIKSATLPGARVPNRSPTPSNFALLIVPARIASIGVSPASTNNSNSRCSHNPANRPGSDESVPTAIGIPAALTFAVFLTAIW